MVVSTQAPRAPKPVPLGSPTTRVDAADWAKRTAERAAIWHKKSIVSSRGGSYLYAGGLFVLLGCFLPLASSGALGQSMSLIPDVAQQVGSVSVVPLVALVFLAAGAAIPRMDALSRLLSAGAVIALASPGLFLAAALIHVGNSLAGTILGSLAQGGVGIGAFALVIGFVCAMIGAFVVLWQSAAKSVEGAF